MNGLYPIRSAAPIHSTTEEIFVEYVTVGGERQRQEFTRTISWLYTSESRVLYLHGGEILREDGLYGDGGRYLTSFDECSARESAEEFGVDATSSLEIAVRTRVFLRPVHENEEVRRENAKLPPGLMRHWAEVPDSWRKEVITDGQRLFPRLAEQELAEEHVWSSKKSESENEAVLQAFVLKWRPVEVGASDLAEAVTS